MDLDAGDGKERGGRGGAEGLASEWTEMLVMARSAAGYGLGRELAHLELLRQWGRYLCSPKGARGTCCSMLQLLQHVVVPVECCSCCSMLQLLGHVAVTAAC